MKFKIRMKICKYCGKIFITLAHNRKYHRECAKLVNKEKLKFTNSRQVKRDSKWKELSSEDQIKELQLYAEYLLETIETPKNV